MYVFIATAGVRQLIGLTSFSLNTLFFVPMIVSGSGFVILYILV